MLTASFYHWRALLDDNHEHALGDGLALHLVRG
jgi:hypothetical protein